MIHDEAPGNVCAHERVEQGDVDQGFAASDRVFEGRYTFPMVYHYSMEPHAAVARYGADGIDLWSSAQHPFIVQGDIARIFGVTRSQVRLRVSFLGGGFGGKSYSKFEPLVVVLSRKAGRPVRVCLSVSEAMVTVRRHGATVKLKTGVKNDGTLVARQAEIHLDTGAYTENTRMVAQLAATRVLGPYRIPHLRSDVYSVHTNAGSAGSFRSVAGPQTLFACESQMDEIATDLGMDPLDLRDRNLLKRGETLQPKLRPVDVDLHSSLRRLASGARWRRRTRDGQGAAGHGLRLHQRRRPVARVRGAGAPGRRRPRVDTGGQHRDGPGGQDGVHPDRRRGAGVAAGPGSGRARGHHRDALRPLHRGQPLHHGHGPGGPGRGPGPQAAVARHRGKGVRGHAGKGDGVRGPARGR